MGNVWDRVDDVSLNETGVHNVSELNESIEKQYRLAPNLMFQNDKTPEAISETAIYKFQDLIERKYRLKFGIENLFLVLPWLFY
jgi:hypothetical protein